MAKNQEKLRTLIFPMCTCTTRTKMNCLLPLILEPAQQAGLTHPQIDLVPQEAKGVAVPKALDQGLNDDQIHFGYN